MAITTPQVNQTQPAQQPAKRTIPYTTPGQVVPFITQAPQQPNQPPVTPTMQAPQVQAPQPVQAPQTQPAGANQQVLQAGQNKAIQGFQSPTVDMLSQQTQGLLQNPNAGGMDWSKFQQAQLEQYDSNRAQAMDAAKQQLAPVWNTGGALGQFSDLALKGSTDRSALGQNLAREASTGMQENLYKALSEGRQTAETERQRFSTDIGALAQVRQMAEGEESRTMTQSENAMDRGMTIALANQNAELQTGLTELKGKIDQGMLLQTQDFEGVQNQLNRELQNALASGNWQNAIKIETLRGEIQTQQAEAQRIWQAGERVATQTWSSSERIDVQSFQTGMQYLKQEQDLALQSNNLENARYLQTQQGLLNLKMQTNEMESKEKMTYLNAQLAEASANNDVGRQQEIIKFQSGQDMERIIQGQGWEAGQLDIRQKHDLALQQGDFVKAEALQRNELEFRATEALKDRALEQMKIDLEQSKVDMDQVAQQYTMIQDQVEAGTLDADAGYNFLVTTLKESGIDTSKYNLVDAQEQAKRALSAEYDNMRYQFQLTHSEFVDPATKQLSSQGAVAFNEFFNKNMYGELTAEERAGKLREGYLPGNDLAIAQVGDKIWVETATKAPNGTAVPVGKYSIIEETDSNRSDFWGSVFGESHTTQRYAISEDGKTRIALGSPTTTKAGNGFVNQLIDPFNLGVDVKI